MEKLLEDCELNCAEDNQIHVVERCLQLVHQDREERSRNLGWLLLAKVLERCTAQCLRSAQSRMAKKLPEMAKAPNMHSGIFLRQMLVRNPQVGDLHAGVIDRIILALVDRAVQLEDDQMRALSIELFSVRYGCSNTPKLLSTLEVLLKGALISVEQRAGLLDLKSIHSSQLRPALMGCLFDMFSSSLEYAKQGDTLPRDQVLSVMERGLKEESTRDVTLHAIAAMCTNVGSAAMPMVPRLVSMLVSQLESSSEALFSTLSVIGRLYGASSTLHKHFYILFSAMKHPLTEQSYGVAAADLLAVIVRSSSSYLKAEVLLAVQRTICDQAVRNPSSVEYRRILEALLSSTNPLVPVPVHIARTVLERCPTTMVGADNLSALCDVITRPRVQNLAISELQRRAPTVSSNFVKMEVSGQGADGMDSDNACAAETFDREVDQILKEIDTQKNDEMEDSEEVVMDSQESSQEKDQPAAIVTTTDEVVSTTTTTTVKRVAVTSAINNPDPTPKKKFKKKKAKSVQPTILQDGEASVEDILSSFCPS